MYYRMLPNHPTVQTQERTSSHIVQRPGLEIRVNQEVCEGTAVSEYGEL